MEKLETIVEQALASFAGAGDSAQLEQVKGRYLGKGGALTELQDQERRRQAVQGDRQRPHQARKRVSAPHTDQEVDEAQTSFARRHQRERER